MKILLFGGAGQLGYEVQKRAHDLNFELFAPVISEVDITDASQVSYLVDTLCPSIVINSAAFTAVDLAETERTLAFQINEEGARNVAAAAKKYDARVLYISTDYVFPGTGSSPLSEDTPTEPLGVYGESKLAGEKAVLDAAGDLGLVVRTSSLFGLRGVNFVATMLDLFAERQEVRVVSDQVMSPTWAGWLAEVLLDLCRIPASGVLHASCAGAISWFDFATAILGYVQGKIPQAHRVSLAPVSASDFPRPARRPRYSVLACDRLASLLGRPPLPWEEGLRAYLRDQALL